MLFFSGKIVCREKHCKNCKPCGVRETTDNLYLQGRKSVFVSRNSYGPVQLTEKRKVVRKHSWHCFAQALNKYQKGKKQTKAFFQFCLIESVEGTKIFIKSRLGGLGYVLLGYVKKKRQKKYNHVSTVT